MNDPRTQLKDLIHVEKGIIPANLCDHIVKDIETRPWKPHTWYNNVSDSYGSEETMELDVQGITAELQQLLTPIMIQAGAAYNQKYAYLRCDAGYFENLYFGVKGNVFYCCHDYHQDYSCGNINDTPLAELLESDSYYQQKQNFMQNFCRKCEQARPLQTVN